MDVSRKETVQLSKEESLDRWEEYIAELYDDERSERLEINKTLEGRLITKDEIEIDNCETNEIFGPC